MSWLRYAGETWGNGEGPEQYQLCLGEALEMASANEGTATAAPGSEDRSRMGQ